jgi:hypothetical protein
MYKTPLTRYRTPLTCTPLTRYRNPLTCTPLTRNRTPLTCTPLTCTPLTCTPLTCVSGFWPVKNKHENHFLKWFKTTLRINCPYVFFSTKEGIELIKTYRLELPTYYIECNISDFHSYQYKDKMATHPSDCPSIELNLIWNEKLILIDKARQINPFNSEFFCWVDAGLCVYRETPPPATVFPALHKLHQLPKDKFIYTESFAWNPPAVDSKTYYHHISGTYILHRDIIQHFTELYKQYMERIFQDDTINKSNIWTDQVILTHIYKKYSNKFYKLCNGYGTLFLALQ